MRSSVRLKTILLATAMLAGSFFVSLKSMDRPAPRGRSIIARVAIALTPIRDAADRGAPRTFAGKADNPVSQILQNADIGWTASRGPITASGAPDVLSLATPLSG